LSLSEQYLKGKKATDKNFKEAVSLAMQDAKGYGYNNFKLTLAPNTVVDTLNHISWTE